MVLSGEVEKLKSMLLGMARRVKEAVEETRILFTELDPEKRKRSCEKVEGLSLELDRIRRGIVDEVLTFIARRQPLGRDLLVAHAVISIAYDMYRISRYCREIAKIDLLLAPEAGLAQIEGLARVFDEALAAVGYIINDISEFKPVSEGAIVKLDEAVDEEYRDVIKRVASSNTVDRGTALKLLIMRHIERIVDHVCYVENHLKYVQ